MIDVKKYVRGAEGTIYVEGGETLEGYEIAEELNSLAQCLEAAERELSRYSMSAGHADQRRAESRAVRKVLGFGEDADNVSPRDLVDAIERYRCEQRCDELRLISDNGYFGYDGKKICSHIYRRLNELRRQAEEGS